ncbi:MAG TPA: Vms1/Ankzf1 family peptidyl-tRNA hydrolase [bacterium]|nr:Vms1/Ankzf1 family peptidyl-tRNA hydrolase [bacterium]
MNRQIDLRTLAEMQAPERAFLSLYLSGPAAWPALDKQLEKTAALLGDVPDEREYFTENAKQARKYLRQHPPAGPLCLFACWALDFFAADELPVAAPDLVWVDSSPYIRPLAEMRDEYETFAVVVADNEVARVFLVASAKTQDERRIKGEVKNHVRKGGWSQQRYERRRDKQLLLYAKEIAAALAELQRENAFHRLLLVGSRETLAEIERVLPADLREKLVGDKALDLHQADAVIEQELFTLFFAAERAEERSRWERIKEAYLRGGRGAVGAQDVLRAAQEGRAELVVVNRDAQLLGVRCREADHLSAGRPGACPQCGSPALFQVDLVNEITELLTTSGAEIDFVEPLPGLREVGDIAALLRW